MGEWTRGSTTCRYSYMEAGQNSHTMQTGNPTNLDIFEAYETFCTALIRHNQGGICLSFLCVVRATQKEHEYRTPRPSVRGARRTTDHAGTGEPRSIHTVSQVAASSPKPGTARATGKPPKTRPDSFSCNLIEQPKAHIVIRLFSLCRATKKVLVTASTSSRSQRK